MRYQNSSAMIKCTKIASKIGGILTDRLTTECMRKITVSSSLGLTLLGIFIG